MSIARVIQISGPIKKFPLRYFSSVECLEPIKSDQNNSNKRHDSKLKLGPINIIDAVKLVKDRSWAKFDETIEISVNLGLDPRKPNQSIKGVASLPNGTGKKVRVCVFAMGDEAIQAMQCGADIVGGEELIDSIKAGNINFDTVIATPQMMPTIAKIGRVILKIVFYNL